MFDHFSWLGPVYERVISPPDPAALQSHLALPCDAPCRLLDAGGGTGRVASLLRPYVSQLVICDLAHGMMTEATQKPGLDVVAAPAQTLPFCDGAFDRTLAVDALHHFGDQAGALREMWRVLAPGGRLVIEEPDITRFGVKLVALGEKLAMMTSHFLRAEAVAALLEEVGAQPRVVRQGHNFWVVAHKEQPK